MTQFFILMFSWRMLVLLNNCVTGCFTPRLDLVVVGPDWFLASSLTSQPSSIILIIFLDSESPSPWFDGADELVLSSQPPQPPSRKLLRVMTFIQLSAPTDEEGPTSRGFGSRGMKGHGVDWQIDWWNWGYGVCIYLYILWYILYSLVDMFMFIQGFESTYIYAHHWRKMRTRFPKKLLLSIPRIHSFRHQVVQAEASAGWCEAFEWHGTQQRWRWDDSTSSTCFCAQVRTVRLLRLAAGFKPWQGFWLFLLTSIEMRSEFFRNLAYICIHRSIWFHMNMLHLTNWMHPLLVPNVWGVFPGSAPHICVHSWGLHLLLAEDALLIFW